MPVEQIKTPDTRENILETLTRKHDQLVEEAAELEYEINKLRKELKANREKKFLRGDKKREKIIEQEFDDTAERMAWHEAELKEIWKKINEIQTELLKLETEKE